MASNGETEERLRASLADRYRIEREIGTGGMATVYLAQDLKHNRQVAIKVLNPELAAVVGTERFLGEIRTTANLSHPHILPLHDSGEAGGFLFYVMPLVEGENLRQKLDQDGQLQVEEAVRIAGHVADALDHAHRHGVIHRDLKPANILFQDGEPVVADFGIALAVSAAGEGRLTETGLSLGTPYYMSPEQAAGDQIPKPASDVYSLGCVLYEMLTGDPPHTGSSAQAILGKILLGEVTRPSELRRTIPDNVESTILKALERLPADRFESISEMGAALKDKDFSHVVGIEPATAGGWKSLALSLGALALLAVAFALFPFFAPEPPPPVLRQLIVPPGEGAVPNWSRFFALAPDGSSMVYRDTVGLDSDWQLWVKERGSVEGRPLSGTTGASEVVYSPNGEWIAFRVGTTLYKRPIQGAGATMLLEGLDGAFPGLSWWNDETILCEGRDGTERALVRVPQDGSPPDTVFAYTGEYPNWVEGLPGREAALVVRCVGSGCMNGTYLSVVDFQADSTWMVLDEVLKAWYLPTGHVVWVRRDGAVFATPFSLARLEWSGAHVSLFEGIRTDLRNADIVMGDDGTIVFVQGAARDGQWELVWVDREGREEAVEMDLGGDLRSPALSPDGTRIAVGLTSQDDSDVWVAQLPRRATHRVTLEGGFDPRWSPDGQSVLFSSVRRGGRVELFTKRADGSGDAELLLEYDRALVEGLWTSDAASVVLRTGTNERGNGDILLWEVAKGAEPVPLMATEFWELAPTLSPDGRFLAFAANYSGEYEVYVRPFPKVDEWREQVSVGGGREPLWARNGRELFYRKGRAGTLASVDIGTVGSFQVLEESVLFPTGKYRSDSHVRQYDVTPDGQRFLMLRPSAVAGASAEPRMILIQNFFTLLDERLRGHG